MNVNFSFDGSGNLKAPTATQLAETDEAMTILAYSHGTAADGRPYYAYLAVKPSKYEEFYRRSAARETFALGEYGEVLASDYAKGPTLEIIRHMKEVYGYDENYEDSLKKEITLQRAAFLKAEKERMDNIVNTLKNKKED